MKKFYSLLFFAALVCTANAQGVSRMFGLVGGYPQSDNSSNGFLYSTDSTGKNVQLHYSFPVFNPGANPANVELAAYNGKLYGLTPKGGKNDMGVLFEYDPATNVYVKKYEFGSAAPSSNDGTNPYGSLLLYNNKFYGLTNSGNGASYYGTIFEWDPATNVYTTKYSFNISTGGFPQNSLRLMNGKMYGTTITGGSATNFGVVFEWDPATNTYKDLLDLTGPGAGNGWGFYTNVTVYNNKLYCASYRGAANDAGALYVIDPLLPNGSNTTIAKVFDVSSGTTCTNNEMIVYNNKLYGTLSQNGASYGGTIFELDPATNTFTKLADFNPSVTGSVPAGKWVVNGTKFIGMCSNSGANSTGTIYEWDPASPATITKKYDFGINNTDNPIKPGSSLILSNSKFYATTYNGGYSDQGSLFEYDYASGTVTKKLNFNTPENGRIPTGKPTLLNGKLYGTCSTGPQTNAGSLWEYDPSTNIYSRKYKFNLYNSPLGSVPNASLSVYNGKLYGMTLQGGALNYGVVFSYDPATDIYTKTDIQTLGTGLQPDGDLTLYNNKFYGMLSNGGTSNLGIIFSYDPATAVLTKLYDIANLGNNNGSPSSYFLLYNNKLYGCTNSGGANNYGCVFSFDPATNTAVSLADFNVTTTGYNVRNAFALYNGKMYNNATSGGISYGTIFSFDPGNNSITKLYDYTGANNNGFSPEGGLTVNGNKLYSSTKNINHDIAVIALDPTTNTITLQSTYTPTNTSYNLPISHNGLTVAPAFIANGIANNCEAEPVVTIDNTNNNKWVPILNNTGEVVAEIKANGNNLGQVSTSLYIHSGTVREDAQQQLYDDRNMTISVQNPPASNVDIRLYMKTSEFLALKNAQNSLGQPSGVSTISDVIILKNEQASCASSLSQNPEKLSTNTETYEYGYVLSASINTFSTFFFARNNFVVLPVTLTSFNAVKQNKVVLLNWETENEINFSKFILERSTDNLHWQAITQVNAHNTHGRNLYQYTDANPATGINQYRLKQINMDGSYQYSHIARVDFSKEAGIIISPNPASDFINIQCDKKITGISIVDMSGKLVKQISPNASNIYNVSKMATGMYLIRIQTESQVLNSKLFIR